MTQPSATEAKLTDKNDNPQIANRLSAVAVAAIVTVQTADPTYSTNEEQMLNNLKIDVANIIASLNGLADVDEKHGLSENR